MAFLEDLDDAEDIPLTSSDEDCPLYDCEDANDWEIIDHRFDAPETPSTTSDEAPPRSSFTRDSEVDSAEELEEPEDHGELVPRRKPGGYDSRVEQMLYENPELPILITEAGKSIESGGRFIVYTIKTGVRSDNSPRLLR